MILRTQLEIVCPRADTSKNPIVVNIKAIVEVENRVQEIACITPEKAPELLAAFIKGYGDLHEHVTMLVAELKQAERAADRIKGAILLDKVSGILETKGLASSRSPGGSSDLREAVLALDEEYQAAVTTSDQIECIVELLKGKMKTLEKGYYAVNGYLANTRQRLLRTPLGATTEDVEPGQSDPQPQEYTPSEAIDGPFGRPKWR